VDDYEIIKKAILRDGMSQREAAKTFKHGRETIRKILEHGTPPGYQRKQKPVQPIIEPVKHIIDGWIEDEIRRKVHRKQRSNATVIWKRLCADHDFRGSVYPVRRYLQKKKRGGGKEVFFPLQFAAGEEGQVDWGQATVMIGNRLVTVHLFCMRLCYSRAAFVRAYVSEKLECFLDGHVRAFRFFEGVPQSCAYDNLRTAVTWVGIGKERKLNQRFVEMRCHYVFQSRFCNVASGNEKGLAENLVKLTQSNFLAGVPCFASIEELNAYLEKCCIEDLQRTAPNSAKTRGELFEEEKKALLEIAHGDFDACTQYSTFAGKLSLVQHQTNFYSVPVKWAHHQTCLKAFADRIEIYCDNKRVAAHQRCWEKQKYILEYTHYLPLLERKPGALKHARPFKGEPWGEDFSRLRTELEYRYEDKGTQQFIEVLLLFSKYSQKRVKAAVHQCVHLRSFSADAVKSVLDFLPPQENKVVWRRAWKTGPLRAGKLRPLVSIKYPLIILEFLMRRQQLFKT